MIEYRFSLYLLNDLYCLMVVVVVVVIIIIIIIISLFFLMIEYQFSL